MSPNFGFRTLVLSYLFGASFGLDLDINSPDSIKSAAKTLASGIITDYKGDGPEVAGGAPGLLPDPYYWWEAGALFGGLLEYAHLTGDTQFNDLVTQGMVHQLGDYDAFMPANQSKNLGNDDQSFWALAAMTAAEAGITGPQNGSQWADIAANVFNTQVMRWNSSSEECGGGLKWQIFSFNNGYNYKNSISTGNFFLLSARLAKFTGNSTYQEWAEKAFKWTQDVGLMSEFAVFDGADDRQNCSSSSINKIQWTENSAIFAEGAALMWNLTNGDEKWKSAVTGLVNQSSVFQNDKSILIEVACEKQGRCNIDQRAFKGVAIRSWARTALAAPFSSDAIFKMIKASAAPAAKLCEADDKNVRCPQRWTQDSSDGFAGFGETNNALQAVQALLWPQAKALATQSSTNATGGGTSGNGNGNGTGSGNGNEKGNGNPPGGNAAGTVVAPSSLFIAAGLLAMLSL